MLQKNESQNPVLSVVMPCLNEEETIGECIRKIKLSFSESNIDGEILVCDNGSTDRSVTIATEMGARVVHEPKRGYGNAYQTAFKNARGKYFIMADADNTYDLSQIHQFLSKLNDGYEFVTGSRYLSPEGKKNIARSHRIIGNPMITALLNYFFGVKYSDVYCGYRAFTREAYEKIAPVSPGMEFNLELAVNAWKSGLKITEIPIVLGPRKGVAKLRTMRDGWRSLRMMLLYSPNKVFLWPGLFLLLTGIIAHLVLLIVPFFYDGRFPGNVTAIFATIFSVVGFQILALGLYAKSYSWSRRFEKDNKALDKFYKFFKLETGIILGVSMLLAGLIIIGWTIVQWINLDYYPIPHPEWVSFAGTLIILGTNVLFSSLFISAMSMKKS
ncbi:glycosyltransferase family 2 protein [Candidatus Kuenenbacteria bacterium]|nr:glycosyltransferase family 2 protein [Candidatus Kuenenbacteria bacterium]